MDRRINIFIKSLCDAEEIPNVFNQYSNKYSVNAIRRNNLQIYLKQMSLIKPKVMLVGEAPGFHGCRFTGVPFTSEDILINGYGETNLFGLNKGYVKTEELSIIKKEQSATIVWETLSNNSFLPLMWNAFPFHPFKKDNPMKNRTPLVNELEIGQRFLEEIIALYNIEKIIAIGNKAEASLNKMNVNCIKVRHPAHAGKPDFVKGIEAIIA